MLLSPSPFGFRHCRDIISWSLPQLDTFELSPRGLRLTLHLYFHEFKIIHAALNCRYADRPKSQIAIRLAERSLVHSLGSPVQCTQNRQDVVYDLVSPPNADNINYHSSVSIQPTSYADRTTLTLAKESFKWEVDGMTIHISCSCSDLSMRSISSVSERNASEEGIMLSLLPRKPEYEEWEVPAFLVTYGCLDLKGSTLNRHGLTETLSVRLHIRNQIRPKGFRPWPSVCITTLDSKDTEALDKDGLLEWFSMSAGGRDLECPGYIDLFISSRLVTEAEHTLWSFHVSKADRANSVFEREGTILGSPNHNSAIKVK